MTPLEIAHYSIDFYVKNFRGYTPEDKKWTNANLENALRLSFGSQFDFADYSVYLATSSPYYGVLVKDYKTLKELRDEKRPEKGKHSRAGTQVQLKLSKLDLMTKVLILLEGSKFSDHRLNKILRYWQPTKPVIMLG